MKDEIALVDSNIIVYAHDILELVKRNQSISLLDKCWNNQIKLAVSIQNLSEFYFNITKKVKKTLDTPKAREIILKFIEFDNFLKLIPNEITVINAIDISQKYNIEYWDAMLVAVMLQNNIKKIYTEDDKFNRVKEIEVINPFN